MIKKLKSLSKIGLLFSVAYLFYVGFYIISIFCISLPGRGSCPADNLFIFLPWNYLFKLFSSRSLLSIFLLPIIINTILAYYVGKLVEYYVFFQKKNIIRNKYKDLVILLFIIISIITSFIFLNSTLECRLNPSLDDYEKANCYYKYAVKNNNLSICNNIEDLEYKEHCYTDFIHRSEDCKIINNKFGLNSCYKKYYEIEK